VVNLEFMMNIKRNVSALVRCILIMALMPLTAAAQEALPPVENVRIENGLVVWDPQAPPVENFGVVYNIYRVFPAAVNRSGNGVNAQFIATVSNTTEFQPALSGDYIVIAASNRLFSRIDEATFVSFVEGVDGFSGLSVQSRYEIRTNRCDNLVSGQSCLSACDASHIPTGGACRTNGAVVLHQRARFNGFECITTADVSFVETDVFCLK